MSSNSSVQIPFTVMLYISHTYNHGSFNFAREFIKGGGLKSLIELCVSENIHLRGQGEETGEERTRRAFRAFYTNS